MRCQSTKRSAQLPLGGAAVVAAVGVDHHRHVHRYAWAHRALDCWFCRAWRSLRGQCAALWTASLLLHGTLVLVGSAGVAALRPRRLTIRRQRLGLDRRRSVGGLLCGLLRAGTPVGEILGSALTVQ